VNWETAEFDILNMNVLNETMESVCVPVRPGNVVLPTQRIFKDQIAICRKFHGILSTVDDEEEQAELIEEVYKHPTCLVKGLCTI